MSTFAVRPKDDAYWDCCLCPKVTGFLTVFSTRRSGKVCGGIRRGRDHRAYRSNSSVRTNESFSEDMTHNTDGELIRTVSVIFTEREVKTFGYSGALVYVEGLESEFFDNRVANASSSFSRSREAMTETTAAQHTCGALVTNQSLITVNDNWVMDPTHVVFPEQSCITFGFDGTLTSVDSSEILNQSWGGGCVINEFPSVGGSTRVFEGAGWGATSRGGVSNTPDELEDAYDTIGSQSTSTVTEGRIVRALEESASHSSVGEILHYSEFERFLASRLDEWEWAEYGRSEISLGSSFTGVSELVAEGAEITRNDRQFYFINRYDFKATVLYDVVYYKAAGDDPLIEMSRDSERVTIDVNEESQVITLPITTVGGDGEEDYRERYVVENFRVVFI